MIDFVIFHVNLAVTLRFFFFPLDFECLRPDAYTRAKYCTFFVLLFPFSPQLVYRGPTTSYLTQDIFNWDMIFIRHNSGFVSYELLMLALSRTSMPIRVPWKMRTAAISECIREDYCVSSQYPYYKFLLQYDTKTTSRFVQHGHALSQPTYVYLFSTRLCRVKNIAMLMDRWRLFFFLSAP